MEIDTSIYIVAICIIIALIGGRKLRKSMVPLLRLGIILFVVGSAFAENVPEWQSSSQTPLIAPPAHQLEEAEIVIDKLISDAFGLSDHEQFMYTDIYIIGLNNSSILNLSA